MDAAETKSLPKPEAEPSAASGEEASSLLVLEQAEGAPPDEAGTGLAPSSLLLRLPAAAEVSIPVPGFRVSDLLALEPGRVLETDWVHAEDLPLWAGDVQLVWAEFEVVEQKIAVRVTRLV